MQTDPQPYPLSQATDPVADQQVYTANWFLGYPGNSGGPFYVQFNGYYYPAGVYLGTLYNGIVPYASAVRAIDSDVVNLITLAATQGDSGTNNSGGVITLVVNQPLSTANPAYVMVQLGPPAAIAGRSGMAAEHRSSQHLPQRDKLRRYGHDHQRHPGVQVNQRLEPANQSDSQFDPGPASRWCPMPCTRSSHQLQRRRSWS
jgi:hypothetical protein